MIDETKIIPAEELSMASLRAAMDKGGYAVVFANNRPLYAIQRWEDFKEGSKRSENPLSGSMRPPARAEEGLSFSAWLKQRVSSAAVRANCMSRCRRVSEGLGISLDEEFDRDGGAELLERLHYSSADLGEGKALPAGLCFSRGANPVTGMASLKSAVRKYFEYREAGGIRNDFRSR